MATVGGVVFLQYATRDENDAVGDEKRVSRPRFSIALVPLTVAGMGWYWTQWQQNVNDLKAMIDLIRVTNSF